MIRVECTWCSTIRHAPCCGNCRLTTHSRGLATLDEPQSLDDRIAEALGGDDS